MEKKTDNIDILEEKEKKAIEIIKFLQYKCIEENGTGMMPIYRIDDLANAITIILNLIEKQSKEIEELKKDKLELINKHVVHLKDFEKELREMRKVIDTKNAEIECLNVIHESYKEMVEENNFISKDKIKAKIEYLLKRYDSEEDFCSYDVVLSILQSLLEKE